MKQYATALCLILRKIGHKPFGYVLQGILHCFKNNNFFSDENALGKYCKDHFFKCLQKIYLPLRKTLKFIPSHILANSYLVTLTHEL